MKSVIASVQDVKAEFFGRPFTARSEAEAVRMFADGIKDNQTQMSQHPEDFILYHIGLFNDETGEITPGKPRILIAGTSLITKA